MKQRSPTDVFALLVLLFGCGGVALAVQEGSILPIMVVVIVLWVLLKVTNFLERLK
jgi:hypothetical protein